MYNLIDHPRWDYKLVHADLEPMIQPAELITQLVVQLAKDNHLYQLASNLSYFPRTLWARFKKNFEELDLWKVKVKLREELRPHWQETGEELFRRIADSEKTVVFILDEFPMMIDRMARSERYREEAKTMLRWLRALRQSPTLSKVHFLIAGSIGLGQVLNGIGEISSINDFEQIRIEPFPNAVASSFLDELAAAQGIELSDRGKRKMLQLIGIPVPYFIQIIFSEVVKVYRQDGQAITPKQIEQVYREKVLGVDCKTYFDHYHARLRDYYKPHEEKAIKLILRELAVVGELTPSACFQFYREGVQRPEEDEFKRLMNDLENDFYVRFGADERQYVFACKVLRDWWLRHHGLDVRT